MSRGVAVFALVFAAVIVGGITHNVLVERREKKRGKQRQVLLPDCEDCDTVMADAWGEEWLSQKEGEQ